MWEPYVSDIPSVKPSLEDLCSREGQKKRSEFSQRRYPLSPAGLELMRIGGSPLGLVLALSGQSQTDKVIVSGQTINSNAVSSRLVGYFFRVVPKRFAYYTWPWP